MYEFLQRKDCVQLSKDNLALIKHNNNEFLRQFVTMDETAEWLVFYESRPLKRNRQPARFYLVFFGIHMKFL